MFNKSLTLLTLPTLVTLLASVILVPQAAMGADRQTPAPVASSEPTPVAPAPTPSATPSATPKTVTTELNLIRKSIEVGNYGPALALLKVTDKSFPNNADVNNLLGYTSRKLKQYSQAAIYYTRALKIDPKHLGALEYQGELFLIQKKSSAAKSNLAKIKSICGTNCEEYQELKQAIGKK